MYYRHLLFFTLFSIYGTQAADQVFKTESINTERVKGLLHLPVIPQASMAAIVLGGSSGRINTDYSERLAGVGITALSLAYFRSDGQPESLDNIPIETVSSAIDFLETQHQISGFGVLGVSRGSELAFLSAINDTRINAVIAIVPSSVAWHGQNSSFAWTHNKQEVPTLSFVRQSEQAIYNRALTALKTIKAQDAFFKFEKIRGSVLLISAKNDHIWPSEIMANQIIKHLEKNQFKFPFQHLSVDDNHFIDASHINDFQAEIFKLFKNSNGSQ